MRTDSQRESDNIEDCRNESGGGGGGFVCRLAAENV